MEIDVCMVVLDAGVGVVPPLSAAHSIARHALPRFPVGLPVSSVADRQVGK